MASVGYQLVGSVATASTRAWAYQVTMPEDGDIASITAYLTGSNGTRDMRASLYSDNGSNAPLNVLAESLETLAFLDGWVTASFSAPYSALASEVLWLVVQTSAEGTTDKYREANPLALRGSWVNTYGIWPDPHPGLSITANEDLSFYATYTPASGGAPIVLTPEIASVIALGSVLPGVLGSLVVTPQPSHAKAAGILASALLGSVTNIPSLAVSRFESIDPATVLSSLGINVPVALVRAAVGDPSVVLGSAPITVVPADALAETFDLSLLLSSVSISIAPADAVAVSSDPGVLIQEQILPTYLGIRMKLFDAVGQKTKVSDIAGG